MKVSARYAQEHLADILTAIEPATATTTTWTFSLDWLAPGCYPSFTAGIKLN
jgi:hypothetical protein